MAVTIRNLKLDKALDQDRIRRTPTLSRAAMAEEILRQHYKLGTDRKPAKK